MPLPSSLSPRLSPAATNTNTQHRNKRTNRRAHEELISEAKLQPVETAESGTTATVAVLVPRGELVVGWTGDSMAIVHRVVPPSKRSPTRSTRSKKVYPRVLCRIEEHTLYHERECDRVEAAGGLITQQTATIRKLIPPGIDIATIRERRVCPHPMMLLLLVVMVVMMMFD